MSKNYHFWGLALLGALLLAGTVFWNQDSAPGASAGRDADVSGGPPMDERHAYSPPPVVGGEVMKDLDTGLLGSALTEPPPGFQAVQPQPPGPLVAAAKQGLGTKQPSAPDSASVVEFAMEAPRDSAKGSVAELAIKTPPDGAGTIPFASASREDEDPSQQQVPLEFDDSETESVYLPAPPSGADPETTDIIDDLSEQARSVTAMPVETSPETGGAGVGEAPEEGGALTASTADEILPTDEQFQSPVSAGEDEAPDPGSSRPDAATEIRKQAPDDQLASTSVDFEPGSVPMEEPEASEAETRREAAHADSAAAVSRDTAIHIERLLNRLGFDPGPVDGVVEPMTVEAIALFEKEQGGEATGEINGQLIAALESKLFESFQQHLERSRRQTHDSPARARTTQPTTTATSPPAGDRQPAKSVTIYGERHPAKTMQSRVSPSDAPPSGARTEMPAMRIETRQEANPIQQVRLQAPTEKTEEKAPNAFEACAQSGKQTEYVKTDNGFVLCEEFSFDAEITR